MLELLDEIGLDKEAYLRELDFPLESLVALEELLVVGFSVTELTSIAKGLTLVSAVVLSVEFKDPLELLTTAVCSFEKLGE
jgi:hypothetical protein